MTYKLEEFECKIIDFENINNIIMSPTNDKEWIMARYPQYKIQLNSSNSIQNSKGSKSNRIKSKLSSEDIFSSKALTSQFSGIISQENGYTGYHHEVKRVISNMGVNENEDVTGYFRSVSKECRNVSMSSQILGGMPAVTGSRIPISLIVSCFKDGMDINEICEDYNLSIEEIQDALEFVVEVLNKPFHEEDK